MGEKTKAKASRKSIKTMSADDLRAKLSKQRAAFERLERQLLVAEHPELTAVEERVAELQKRSNILGRNIGRREKGLKTRRAKLVEAENALTDSEQERKTVNAELAKATAEFDRVRGELGIEA